MSDPGYDRIEEIFSAALERDPAQRAGWLDEVCANDASLKAQVNELLEAHENAGDILTAPAEPMLELPGSVPGSAEVSLRIGQYTTRRVIAAGGMGVVYEAVQEHPHRTVALKVMRSGIASRSGLRRFEYESQILARLRHANIAQVFEAGTYDPGTGAVPYFAMEYIPGARTLTEYANARKLDTQRRLELFGRVCHAVHHGHQKGIIHRDLKPGNILVDGGGEPKIIDFGVARATDSDMAVTSLQTDVGQLIGTLQYMSPEQCAADPHDLDSRSDVYALGVVLYELLSGHLPYVVEHKPIPEAVRLIQEEEAARLSSISRAFRGDIETIVVKALEKDRERRYRSVEALAEDIRRYLRSEPIQARRPDAGYQLSRFARRHRGLVVATAVVFSLLVVGIVVTGVLLVRAVRAETAAREEQTRADDQAAAATEAKAVAVQEKERADAALERVLSLSDIKLVADYTVEADELWPAHPERIDDINAWLKKARALGERLPGHEAELAALQQRAIPRTAEEAAADRASHPRRPGLETARGRLAWLRRSLAMREGGDVDPAPEPGWDALPDEAGALNEIAWPLVDPDRERFGDEARALAIARRAVELARIAAILDTLAWALFACALDADAEEASRRALAAVPEAQRELYQGSLEKMQEAIAQISGPDGLDRLREQVAEADAQMRALEEELSARRTWRFSDTTEQWQHQVLAELVERLRAFGAPDRGTIASVAERLPFASTIEERSTTGLDARAAWAAAIESISDRGACPLYGGLVITAQIGMLPLDRNPQTGLWEFWHIQTGARPAPDPKWPQAAVNRWIITEETGLVFVLVPGGSFRMGAERPRLGVVSEETPEGLAVTAVNAGTLAERMRIREGDVVRAIDGAAIDDSPALAGALRYVLSGVAVTATVLRDGVELELTATAARGIDSPNVDPDARDNRSPVHEVSLDPFFLSKYEMTQGQWLRFVGENPSSYPAGEVYASQNITWAHPVEQVSWNDADRTVRRLALLLPTESQWEYACRAGTTSIWHTGREPRTLAGYANIADEGSARWAPASWNLEEGITDGFHVHAPVGSFRPNRFGLHDVHGNLWELCRDRFTFYSTPLRPVDGLRNAPGVRVRVSRGGCYRSAAVVASSASRNGDLPAYISGSLGLRPSRVVTE